MLSVGHAVAFERISGSNFASAQSRTDTYYEAFGGLFTGGITLLILGAVFAIVALWDVLRPLPRNPRRDTADARQ